MGDEQWQVTVQVPLRLPASVRESLLDRIAATVSEWEPDDRDGWDADVSGQPAAEDSMWKRLYHEVRGLHAEAARERDATLDNFEGALAAKDRIIQRIAADRDRAEASRRDWAAEAMGLDVHADQCWEVLHAIWLYVDWRYITGKLTTEQRELWASAVERVSRADHPDEPLEVERWWRPDSRPVWAVHPEVSP